MKSPSYLAVNPMGKVPTLRHGPAIISECAAICAYLADTFPDAALAPPPGERADYYRWLFFASGPLEAAIVNRSLGFEVAPDRAGMVGYAPFDRMMDTLEAAVSGGTYIAGDRFTAVDVYLGSQIGFGLQFGSIEDRPAFRDYWSRVSERPARRRGTELDDELMPASRDTG
jgi:glutathione S-transferase